MESGFLLNVVVGESPTVLKLLASKDQALLIGGNSFLILNLGLDVIDGITRLDLESDGLASYYGSLMLALSCSGGEGSFEVG